MGKQWKQLQNFTFGGSKITADGDCSHANPGEVLIFRGEDGGVHQEVVQHFSMESVVQWENEGHVIQVS